MSCSFRALSAGWRSGKGATTAHVRIEIAPGLVITASITNESVDELSLKVGGSATAIIKATSVMVGVD